MQTGPNKLTVPQIEQIERALAEQGKTTDRVIQALDHAEWELAEGRMLDKVGQPVADPCAWVFRSLHRSGISSGRDDQVFGIDVLRQEGLALGVGGCRRQVLEEVAEIAIWLQAVGLSGFDEGVNGGRGVGSAWMA